MDNQIVKLVALQGAFEGGMRSDAGVGPACEIG